MNQNSSNIRYWNRIFNGFINGFGLVLDWFCFRG